MRAFLTFILLTIVPLLVTSSPDQASGGDERDGGPARLVELLPDSTVAAVEIRRLEERWGEIRSVRAIARAQDRLLGPRGLDADDLPRLIGDEAVLALVPGPDGRTPIPVALLRPGRSAEVEAALTARRGAGGTDDAPLSLHRGQHALWLGPPGAENALGRLARGDGTSVVLDPSFREVSRRLPDGGLARGWLNPEGMREALLEGDGVSAAGPAGWLRTLLAARLDSVRFVGFRRDLEPGRVVTSAVVGFDANRLPAEVARALNAPASSPPIPSTLPDGVALAASFRLESGAWMPWLEHVAAEDPRGPLRNLDFFVSEFEARTGRDLERDLVRSLGEHGWMFILQPEGGDSPIQGLLVAEAEDGRRAEDTLLDLRGWLAEHAWGRSLGLITARTVETVIGGQTIHGLRVRTPLGELPGPFFLVTDGMLAVGVGERARDTALSLIDAVDAARAAPPTASLPFHESLAASGPALARLLSSWTYPGQAPSASAEILDTVVGALAELGDLSATVTWDEDAVRLRATARLDRAGG